MTADALPTVQIDGVVWDQVIVGDRVYVTGQFANARPAGASPGTSQVPRQNLLAYDLHTGELIAEWAPTLNAQGLAIAASADGSRIFVGGDFYRVNGQMQWRIAALDAETGDLIDWQPFVNIRVKAIAVNGNTVYFGGDFTIVGGQERLRLAAVDSDSGDLLPWAPSADLTVETLAVHPPSGRVMVGGRFWELNGQEQPGMGSLDGVTGQLMPWELVDVVRNGGSTSESISGLVVDGDVVYGVGWVFYSGGGDGTFEGVFAADAMTGELIWVNGCLGDRYGVAVGGDAVYSVGHEHDCGMVGSHPETSPQTWQAAGAVDKRGSTNGLYNAFGPFTRWHYFPGQPATETLHWLPSLASGNYTGKGQAGWTVEATDEYVVIGGEFPRVNGRVQQGLVRFAVTEKAPNREQPLEFDGVQPRLAEIRPGTVRVEWTAAWDRDDRTLTYELLRDSQTQGSAVLGTWSVDSDRWYRPPLAYLDTTAPPGVNTYRVRVNDPDGNGGPSAPTSFAPSGAEPESSAYQERVASLGPVHHWRLGEASGTVAYDWAGSNDLSVWNQARRGVPGALLDELDTATEWPPSSSTSTVRAASEWWQPGPQTFSIEAWFKTSSTQGGKIVGFGNSRTGRSTANTTDRHIYMTNNGRLVFGLRPDYGDRRTIQSGPGFNDGDWHHVVATLSSNGARLYLDGDLVADDPTLTKAQVYWGHWRVAGDRLTSWPSAPTREAFAGLIDEVAVYPAPLDLGQVRGNYVASGRSGGFDNTPPTAAFEWEATWLKASFDASASTDPDGAIVAYKWDFGDGNTAGTSVPTVSHDYAQAGPYTVNLIVVDQLGATDETDDTVTVFEPPLAADTFDRAVAAGWGMADAGGTWALSGPSSNFSVESGFGRIVANAPGVTRSAYLDEVSAADVDILTDVAIDQKASGGGAFVSLLGRRVAPGAQYRAVVWFTSSGQVTIRLIRDLPGQSTILESGSIPALSYSPGQRLQVRFRIDGINLMVKTWELGTAEPAEWFLAVSDETPQLQAPGSVGLTYYMSGSAQLLPIAVSFGELLVEAPQ